MEKSRDGSLLDYNHLLTVSSATTLVLTLASWALLPPSSRTLSTKSASKSSKSKSNSEPSLFLAFQIKYLSVMVLVYLADWLQGSYQYALYKHYGYSLKEIALFFVVGFGSSGLVGTRVASLADEWGRKTGALAFCVFYGLSCATKLDASLWSVLVGRFLGGISTSLFHSVFESWMVGAHNNAGFDDHLLGSTFAWSTFLNGFTAIIAGVLANAAVDSHGLVAPFLLAGVFSLLAFLLISLTWKENYGSDKNASKKTDSKGAKVPPTLSFFQVAGFIVSNPKILATGLIQTSFEICMYIFIFLWGPVLEDARNRNPSASSSSPLPYGQVFSIFMEMLMIGSLIFKLFATTLHLPPLSTLLLPVFAISCLVFGSLGFGSSADSPVSEPHILLVFAVYEICCGIYYPSVASVRARGIPESSRTTVMNWFRVPLNACVVIVLLALEGISEKARFLGCAALFAIGFLCCLYLHLSTSPRTQDKQKTLRSAKSPGSNHLASASVSPSTSPMKLRRRQ